MTMRGKMVHKFSDRADEQRKEAEVVRLRTPPRNIWIDLMTGRFCDPEPIEHGGQVIPFTAPPQRKSSPARAVPWQTVTRIL
jgi:hypothetical protein